MTRKSPFSLIELLAVVAILGVLTFLMLPKYSSFEESTKTAVANYNDATLANFLPTYYAANQGFPSRLHTGLNADGTLLENMPEIIKAHITTDGQIPVYQGSGAGTPQKGGGQLVGDAGGGPWEGSMKNAGILELAYGPDTGITFVEVKGSSNAAKTKAIKVVGNWYNNGVGNLGLTALDPDRPLKFGGTGLEDWVNANPMGLYGGKSSDGYSVYLFFLGKDVKWAVVYNADGTVKNVSKAMINLEKNVWDSNSTLFNYPLAFFKVYKSLPAELIGVVTVSKDGKSFAQYK